MRHSKHAQPIPTGAFVPIKAIETEYANCRFRSRLEARYAVWFDKLGIAWEYETQGYTLNGTTRYLPDFWLPASECWVEIKPTYPNTLERFKLRLLALNTGHPAFCLWGTPAVDAWHITVYLPTDTSIPFITDGNFIKPHGLVYLFKLIRNEPRVTIQDRKSRNILQFLPLIDISYEQLVAATVAARRARFEFGESG